MTDKDSQKAYSPTYCVPIFEFSILQDSMIAAGILPQLVSLAIDSPYDTAEMSRKAAKTFSNITATLENATLVMKVPKKAVQLVEINSAYRQLFLFVEERRNEHYFFLETNSFSLYLGTLAEDSNNVDEYC